MFRPGDEYEIETMVCPFDGAHLMPKSSFVRHIERCKSINKSLFKQCPFDVYHIIRKEHFDTHLINCKSQKMHHYNNQESLWEDASDFNHDIHQHDQTVPNWQNQNILTDSILQQKNLNFNSHNDQSQLLKALQNLNIKQQSEDESYEYWPDPNPNINQKQSQLSNSSKNSINPQIKKNQAERLRNGRVEEQADERIRIKKHEPDVMKADMKRPSQGMKMNSQQKLSMSDVNQWSELSRSSAFDIPYHVQYNQYSPGLYGQGYNKLTVKNQFITYGHGTHSLPPQMAYQQISFYPMYGHGTHNLSPQMAYQQIPFYPTYGPRPYKFPPQMCYQQMPFYPNYDTNDGRSKNNKNNDKSDGSNDKKTQKERKHGKERKGQQKKKKSQKEKEKKTKKIKQ